MSGDGISEARQALRDYARTEVAGSTVTPEKGIIIRLMPLGEMAGKAFMAAQAALTVAEELRAEADAGDLGRDDLAPDERSGYRLAMHDLADRIEAAILKAVQG